MNWKTITFLFSLVLSFAFAADYKASESDNTLRLKTPFGEKTVIGDYGQTNYRIEIPLVELEPEKSRRNGDSSTENKEKNTVESKETKIIETQVIREREPAAVQGPPQAPPEVIPPKVIVEYDDSDRLVLEANRLFNKRKFPEATSVVDELIRRKPSYVRAWIMKGSLMYVRGQKDLAKIAWRQAQALEPESRELKSILEKYK